jgi:glycosyltransferase involved in cell wall biosynthesis
MRSQYERCQRIILVSELFYPEESATAHILTKIAGVLSREFELKVLTGPANYEGRRHQNLSKPPVEEGRIERMWAPDLNKNDLFRRLSRSLLISAGLGWKTLIRSRSRDTVFAVTNPALLLVALALVRKIRRFNLVFLVHDVFPENAVAAGVIRNDHILYPLIKCIFDWAYGSADAVITIGRDMSEVLSRKISAEVNNITLIENWADHPLVEKIVREKSMIVSMGLSEKIVIQYAGNIGRAQGLLEFVGLVSAVENDYIHYVFRGSGALSTVLREATIHRPNFTIAGSYPRSEQSQALGACDVALVILAPKMYGLGVPSKTYNILASGRPVLFLGPKDSEIYRLVKSHGVGWAFDWSEADQMLKLIGSWTMLDLPAIEAHGKKARELAETCFSEAAQLAKFSSFFHRFQRSK